jgi:TPR repeat protein
LTCILHLSDNLCSEFEDGCNNHGSPDGCFSLGEWHQLIAKNENKASEIYAENCLKRQHPSSCFNLAMLLLSKRIPMPAALADNGKESSDQAARRFLKRGCDLKDGLHSQACSAYATLCLSGTGGERDVPSGVSALQKLCDAPFNDARACVRLGSVFLRGESAYPGVKQDKAEAFKFMKRGCEELGHPNGCQVLAVMYSKGDGVEKNQTLAEKYQEMTKDLLKRTGEKMGSVSVDPL